MANLDTALGQLPERRPQQERFAHEVARAVSQGINLVAEAPVGTGKSFAYLLPLALSGVRALVATHSLTLQEQLRNGDLPFVQRLVQGMGLPFTFAVLKGASNYACHLKADRYAMDETLRAWVFTDQPHGHDLALAPPGVPQNEVEEIRTDMDECEGKSCPFLQDCAVRNAKRQAQAATLVVTNQALLMHAAGNPQVIDLSTYGAVVIDEAHQLPDVARGAFSSSVTRHRLLKIFRHLLKAASQRDVVDHHMEQVRRIWCDVANFCAQAREERGRPERGDRWAIPTTLLTERLEDLRAVLDNVSTDIYEGRIWMGREFDREKGAKWVDDLQGTLADIAKGDALGVTVWEVGETKGDPDAWGPPGRLELCPVDVAPILARSFWDRTAPRSCGMCLGDREVQRDGDWRQCPKCNGTGYQTSNEKLSYILTSATLAVGDGPNGMSFGNFLDEVGLPDENTSCYAVGSPFNYSRQAVIYVGAVDEANKRGPASKAWIAELDYLVRVSRGRALALFSSRKGMKEAFFGRGHHYPSRMQEPGVDRMALIEWLRTTPGAVLYATKTFWEGVSIEGDALGLVVIDKVPYPVPTDPVYAARVRAMGGGKAGFFRLAVPLAATALRQGAGRLIRTKHDRGLVAILDGRVAGGGAMAHAALFTMMPGAPIFSFAERREMVQAWADTGAPLDLAASGYDIKPAPAQAQAPAPAKTPAQAQPPTTRQAQAALELGPPPPDWAHPVVQVLQPFKGLKVHGMSLREAGAKMKALLDQI